LEKIQKDEILTSSGRKHRTPQNDGVGGWDCHVAALLAIRLCHNYSVNYLPPLMLIFYSNIGNR
jgi:hypothetical protein